MDDKDKLQDKLRSIYMDLLRARQELIARGTPQHEVDLIDAAADKIDAYFSARKYRLQKCSR